MKKSLIIIASALLVAVGAANGDRLRYDSAVFAESARPAGQNARTVRVEYPPCVKGVREDRCIQLYERGMRRSYTRWLSRHGRPDTRSAARGYPVCRGRADDRCQQRGASRRSAAPVRQAARPAVRRGPLRAAAVRPARAAVTQVRQRPAVVRQVRPDQAAPRPQVAAPRRPVPGNTPGI